MVNGEVPRDNDAVGTQRPATEERATSAATEELRVAKEAVKLQAAAEKQAASAVNGATPAMEMRGGVWVKAGDPGFASALRGVARRDGITVDGSAAAQAAAEAEQVNREAVLESMQAGGMDSGAQTEGPAAPQDKEAPPPKGKRGRFSSLRDEMR